MIERPHVTYAPRPGTAALSPAARGRRLLAAALLGLSLAPAGVASAQGDDDTDRAARELFVQAEQALQAGDRSRYQTLAAQLADYPLLPYLRYADLIRRLSTADEVEVLEFLRRHDGQPLVSRLRRQYVQVLAARGDHAGVVRHFRGGDETLRCQHAAALWQRGQRAAAMQATAGLWRHGKSRPAQCDPAFDAWRAAGGATADEVWTRFRLAMEAGQGQLATYLVRYLPASQRPLAQRWLELRQHPERVRALRPDGKALTGAMVRYGFGRLAGSDREAAMRLWAELRGSLPYRDDTRASIERRIGLGLATDHDPRAVDWLAGVDDRLADEDVRAWRVTSALRHARMDDALAALDRLSETEKQEPRWLYWRARVMQLRGDSARAEALYRLAATDRGYYGFLAADRIGRPYSLNHDPLQPSATLLGELAARGAARRSRELLALDRLLDARREWFSLIDGLPRRELAHAAYLAHRWEWHGMAILTIARAGNFDALDLRFPLPYGPLIRREASRVGIEPGWVRAIMRQESAYMAGARSPAGALGLMQVMPATGRLIARDLGLRRHRTSNLLDPAVSVRFGSTYLAGLRERWGGHQALATASYNAGPHRIKRWLPTPGTAIDGDIWVDTIPFRETRRYVRLVLAYQVIHALREGEQVMRLSERLHAVTPETGTRSG